MNSLIPSIPCGSHGYCATHDCVRSASGVVPFIDETSLPRAGSPFTKLPHELLLAIADHLGDVEKLNLSLTCHLLFKILSKDVRRIGTTTEGGENTHDDLNDFLGLLARDLHERYWHCKECKVLHQRNIQQSQAPGRFTALLGRMGVFRQRHHSDGGMFNISISGVPLLALSYSMVSAIMDRHFLGERNGICMQSICCSGVRSFSCPWIEEGHTRRLRYSFQPRFVLDRLLLKATYIWELAIDEHGANARFSRKDDEESRKGNLKHIYEDLDFRICRHTNMTAVLQAAKRRPQTREVLRCQYCPTQYWVEECESAARITISVWHNFGPCREAGEVRWRHMVGATSDLTEYEWEKRLGKKSVYVDEDIWEAYDRIEFKTRKEYEAFNRASGKYTYAWDDWRHPGNPNHHSTWERGSKRRLNRGLVDVL